MPAAYVTGDRRSRISVSTTLGITGYCVDYLTYASMGDVAESGEYLLLHEGSLLVERYRAG